RSVRCRKTSSGLPSSAWTGQASGPLRPRPWTKTVRLVGLTMGTSGPRPQPAAGHVRGTRGACLLHRRRRAGPEALRTGGPIGGLADLAHPLLAGGDDVLVAAADEVPPHDDLFPQGPTADDEQPGPGGRAQGDPAASGREVAELGRLEFLPLDGDVA